VKSKSTQATHLATTSSFDLLVCAAVIVEDSSGLINLHRGIVGLLQNCKVSENSVSTNSNAKESTCSVPLTSSLSVIFFVMFKEDIACMERTSMERWRGASQGMAAVWWRKGREWSNTYVLLTQQLGKRKQC
jgi:hypothetical protein